MGPCGRGPCLLAELRSDLRQLGGSQKGGGAAEVVGSTPPMNWVGAGEAEQLRDLLRSKPPASWPRQSKGSCSSTTARVRSRTVPATATIPEDEARSRRSTARPPARQL